jgi:hypothetical protein
MKVAASAVWSKAAAATSLGPANSPIAANGDGDTGTSPTSASTSGSASGSVSAAAANDFDWTYFTEWAGEAGLSADGTGKETDGTARPPTQTGPLKRSFSCTQCGHKRPYLN